MQRAFIDIRGVKTPVLTYGRWLQSEPNGTNDIILLIPGNPGVTGFYKMFMHTLYEKTGYPVWIVGHAGHEIPKNGTMQALKNNKALFGLEGQIEHKKDFIKNYIPENAKVHLVGHSIGSYIILNLLKDKSFNAKVVDVNLLFPTVEHMAQTPNGKFLTNFVKPILWLVLFLAWIYAILPSFLQNTLMYLYMKLVCLPKMHFRTLVHFIEPSILEKVFFMAFEELDQVNERDDAVIQENVKKIRFFYGKNDGWAPSTYCDKIKKDIPDIRAELSQFDHAFVLHQSRDVGLVVSQCILNK